MRKLIFTSIILLASILSFAQPADSLKKANDYYSADKIAKAITAYEAVANDGYESAELYFNLGNAYYKNNEVVKAILYYEKAKLLAPNDEDIQFNLDLANQFVVDKIETLPQPFFVQWLKDFTHMFKADQWGIISIAFFILTLIFALGYAFLKKTGIRKLSFSLGILMLIMSIVCFGFGRNQHKIATSHNYAIVFSPSVTAKASPNESSVDLFVVHEGLKVQLLQELNGWLEIKLADGSRGWIQQEVLEVI